MKTMFDTSVLVAAMIPAHQHHHQAAPWLRRAHAGDFPWFICAHSLAECYATLTAPTRSLGFAPALAVQAIRENVTAKNAVVVELTTADYQAAIENVATLGLASGVIYDALIATAAQKVGIERFLTLNVKHFLRVWQGDVQIIQPP
jgi:predicted nucleic acid-binding protein